MFIGKDGTANIRFFHGSLDEVRFWNRALSPQEVQEKYNNIHNNNNGLVAYWNFDQEIPAEDIDFVNAYYNSLLEPDSLELLMFLPTFVEEQ